MASKKHIRRLSLLLVIIIIPLFIWYLNSSLPLISAYGAKALCSAVFLQHRNPEQVIEEDLADFPFSLASYNVNFSDSSVSANVLGLAEKKAIFRIKLGATLVNDFSETQIREQIFSIPDPTAAPGSLLWPYGNRIMDSMPGGINKPTLDSVLKQEIFDTINSAHTRALVVIYNGQLVAEQYAPGFSNNTVMPAWSAAKSITGLLIGILVKKYGLNVDSTAPVPQWNGTKQHSITVKQLLQQTSGLNYAEKYIYPSEATTMLFKRGDMARYAEGLPLKYPPGTVFNYSSGNSNILSGIIKRTIGERDYASFPYKELLYKIGMRSAVLEPDASGMYVGSSFCYATARDFAKLGLLCLNNGSWNNEEILPQNWIQQSTQPSNADLTKNYGYQFWLNGFEKPGASRSYPNVPADMYYASGYGGQGIYIIPSKKMVIVRLGLNKTNENKLIAEILATLH